MEQPKEKLITYDDYLNLPDDPPYELIGGVLYMITAPSPRHQKISFTITSSLKEIFPCDVIQAVDVIFPEGVRYNGKLIDCVEPDIMVICDPKRITEKNIQGPPDLIVEILSPSNSSNDCILKRELYERNGVSEYWIIDPQVNILYIFKLLNKKYPRAETYRIGDKIILNEREFTVDF